MSEPTENNICIVEALSTRPARISLQQAFAVIRAGAWKRHDLRTLIDQIRSESDKERKAMRKRQLPAFMFSGTFSKRGKEYLEQHSGLLCVDFDGKDNPETTFAVMRQSLVDDPHTFAAFTSPSGDGVKVIVPVQAGNQAEHYACFKTIKEYYRSQLNLKADDSGKDVSRLCFASYDPEIVVKETAVAFLPAAEEPRTPATAVIVAPAAPGRLTVEERARRYVATMPPAVSGEKGSVACLKVAIALCCGFALTPDAAAGIIASDYNPRCTPPWTPEEIMHKVESAASFDIEKGYLLKDDFAPRVRATPPQHPHPVGREPVQPAEDNPYPETDTGNAQRMVDIHGGVIRHTTAGDWLIWTGKRWKRSSETIVHQWWMEIAAQMLTEAGDDNDRKKWALKCQNSVMRKNMIASLGVMPEIVAEENEFDAPSDLIPCDNGVIDLATGDFRGQHDPADMNTRCASADYVPDATYEPWDKFLLDLVRQPDGEPNWALLDYLQQAAGLSLTPHIGDAAVFVLVGGGRNGKSTFLDAIRGVIGEYVARVTTDVFNSSDTNNGNQRDLAINDQQGARMTIGTEIPQDMRLNEALIKTFTETTLTGRALYQASKTFTNTTKLWLYGNYRPYVRDADQGIWRRLKLIEFNNNLDPAKIDYDLGKKLETPQAKSAILSWLVQGARAWNENGRHLITPDCVTQATTRWRADTDKIGMFIDDRCDLAAGYETPAMELYRAFKHWCEDCGYKAQAYNSFRNALTSWTGGRTDPPVKWDRDMNCSWYVGISVRP